MWTVPSGLRGLRSTADLHADPMQGRPAQRHGLPWIKKKMPTNILVHPQGSGPLSDSWPYPLPRQACPAVPGSPPEVLLILPLYLAKVQAFLSSSAMSSENLLPHTPTVSKASVDPQTRCAKGRLSSMQADTPPTDHGKPLHPALVLHDANTPLGQDPVPPPGSAHNPAQGLGRRPPSSGICCPLGLACPKPRGWCLSRH